MIARRSVITGLVALVAAPAIVRVLSLMPVNAALQPDSPYLSLQEITREAVRLFENSNQMFVAMTEREISDYEFYKGEQHSVDVLYGSTDQNLSSDDVKSRMERQYDAAFAADGAKIGDQLRIRLPNDYASHPADAFRWALRYNKERRTIEQVIPAAIGPLALAAAAVAVAPVLLEKPVTRRFWSK